MTTADRRSPPFPRASRSRPVVPGRTSVLRRSTPPCTPRSPRFFHRWCPRSTCGSRCPTARVIGGGGPTRLMRKCSDDFFRRLGSDGLIGSGEAFMAGDWDADDPAAVLTPFARGWTSWSRVDAAPAPPLRAHQPKSERNTKTGAHQHQPSLRPVERVVRTVPRRDHDLLERACFDHPTWWRRLAGRRAAPQDRLVARRTGVGSGPRCSRSALAGARLLCAAQRGRPSPRSRCRRSKPRWHRERAQRVGWRAAPTCSCGDTATSKVATTRS
jgi:cyclopropane-fatty-acyl-phospholipid synthase